MSADSYDLRAEIRNVLDGTGLTDPRDIATKVAENIPAKFRLAALRVALVPLVEQVNQQRRMSSAITGTGAGTDRPASRSAKVSAIRDAWQVALRDRIHVGQGPAAWKLLGDCGYDDLMFAASERREHARRNAAKARRYAALAELLHTHGVATVGELPTDALADTLTSERAA